ncbi:MAG TPA: long-chain fatty acid--CoA ligase [Nitrolancea sp.]
MDGLMMDFQLTLPAILRRADTYFGPKEIVSREPDRSLHRYTYREMAERAKRLAVALQGLGIQSGDRVGTLAWNHHQHLEAYFGVPLSGGVLHTLNLRLHPTDLAYIINHADDQVILVDDVLWPLFEAVRGAIQSKHVIVFSHPGVPSLKREGTLDYEELLASADIGEFAYPEFVEERAAALCYTSGTTGRPKGVLYSHRAVVLHSFATALTSPASIGELDTVMPVVPMFHVNAWGMPFTSTMMGAKQVFPGPYLDGASLLELLDHEKVTLSCGVPTLWLGVLQLLDNEPGKYDVSRLKALLSGGQAAPESMVRGFLERHGVHVYQGWGMTETTPVAAVCYSPDEHGELTEDEKYAFLVKHGRPLPFVEMRVRNGESIAPWDGATMGELEVRGPWVAASYYHMPEAGNQFTDDGWFRTGDIATIDELGYMEIRDRLKDVIKSGGEWISSLALENALMGHPAVAEAAVIAVPDPHWLERPVAVVVLREGQTTTDEELRAFLAPNFAKWWLPDAFEFRDAIPRTSTGKFQKSVLRDELAPRYKQMSTKQPAS